MSDYEDTGNPTSAGVAIGLLLFGLCVVAIAVAAMIGSF